MVRIFNQKNLSFEFERFDMPDFSSHTSPDLAQWVQSKHLQFDVRSLDPDKYSCPYHFHRNAEELFVILSGRATLRTPEGLTELSEGDIVFFGTGPEGAHQLYNHTQEPCRYLDIRTEIGLDVCEYPDSGKINVRPYGEIYRSESKVDYFDGEDKIREKWRELSEKPAQNR